MTVGLSATGLANLWLDTLGGAAATPGATLYVQNHSDDPGADGTATVATTFAATPRPALVWNAAAAGSKSISNQPEWTATSAGTCAFLSVWDADNLGNFRFSAAYTSRTLAIDDILRLTGLTFSLTPIAA